MKGANLRSVQELLRHKTPKMTTRYTHLSPPHLREAVRLLEDVFVPKQEDILRGGRDKIYGHYMDTTAKIGTTG